MTGTASQSGRGSAEQGRPNRGTPLIFAHRGASADRVEQTRSAYLEAVAQGADGVETDVRLTADRALVCWHDADVSRITGAAGFVHEMTLDELRAITPGGPDELLTLSQLLELLIAAGRPLRLALEIKQPSPFGSDLDDAVLACLADFDWNRSSGRLGAPAGAGAGIGAGAGAGVGDELRVGARTGHGSGGGGGCEVGVDDGGGAGAGERSGVGAGIGVGTATGSRAGSGVVEVAGLEASWAVSVDIMCFWPQTVAYLAERVGPGVAMLLLEGIGGDDGSPEVAQLIRWVEVETGGRVAGEAARDALREAARLREGQLADTSIALGPDVALVRRFPDVVREWAASRPVRVWTVNDVDAARACLEVGVRELTTDRPGSLRAELSAAAGQCGVARGGRSVTPPASTPVA